MKTYHVAYISSWPDGERYWQAHTDVDCLSPDAVYYTVVRAKNKKEAIENARSEYDERESSGQTRK